MLTIKDTEIKDGRYKPGKLLENGQRMVRAIRWAKSWCEPASGRADTGFADPLLDWR
jgi:hypothetical protein